MTIRSSFVSFGAPLAVAIALMASPASVSASPVNATEFEAPVAHDDLDLTTRDGVARLDERVRTKAHQMCANGGRDSASLRLERECRASALAAAAPEIRVAIANARADRVRFAENTPASPDATPGA
ncbi:UrcA family protein [Porphyrobacter sp. YT40]|uniref:UrcA family protein n=1 Tax=Porphyrobacter sp. YT40 TaxID=2547601 RepID=UPI0011438E81|nr:UrcA family protein [Porphyrobacter sp. YT40]QDH34920.1 UrcA family protein [Porphyrobacter sp. YT40]